MLKAIHYNLRSMVVFKAEPDYGVYFAPTGKTLQFSKIGMYYAELQDEIVFLRKQDGVTEQEATKEEKEKELASALSGLGLTEIMKAKLEGAGITRESLVGKSVEELTAIDGIGKASAEKIYTALVGDSA